MTTNKGKRYGLVGSTIRTAVNVDTAIINSIMQNDDKEREVNGYGKIWLCQDSPSSNTRGRCTDVFPLIVLEGEPFELMFRSRSVTGASPVTVDVY